MRGRPPKSPVVPSRKIWVDSDLCPPPILQVLCRMAELRRMILTLVGTRSQVWPQSAYIRSLQVAAGFDSVTGRITAMQDEGDYVITDDAALAQAAARRRVTAINTRGEPYGGDGTDMPPTVASFMAAQSNAPRGLAEVLLRKDQQTFAARFDHVLTRVARAIEAAKAAKAKKDAVAASGGDDFDD